MGLLSKIWRLIETATNINPENVELNLENGENLTGQGTVMQNQ